MPFRWIPATGPEGFLMGSRGYHASEEPRHRVVLNKPFLLASVPVTQEQFACWTTTPDYAAWYEKNEERIRRTSYSEKAEPHCNHFEGRDQHPAEQVTWWEAWQLGEWLQAEARRQLAEKGIDWQCDASFLRLPTEAEWEYGSRAWTETEYHGGDGEAALPGVGWFLSNAGGTTQEVGQLGVNSFGLYDMHGNVWEWCADAWNSEAYRERRERHENPLSAWEQTAIRVVRGGSWRGTRDWCRSSFRYRRRPGGRSWDRGFRLGLFPGPEVFPVSGKQTEKPTAEPASAGVPGAGEAAQGNPEDWDSARFPSVDQEPA